MEMLSPLNTEYLRIIRLRTPISESQRFFKGIEYLFKKDTFVILEKFLRALCDMEVDIEESRRRLSDTSNFKLKEIFKSYDLNERGYLTKKDVNS